MKLSVLVAVSFNVKAGVNVLVSLNTRIPGDPLDGLMSS